MFGGCKNIININFKYFNTNNIINMKYMFIGCKNIKKLDLSSFNTKNVINMEGMFGEYNNISNLDLSSIDVLNPPKDSDKKYYDGCKNLKELNLSSFNTQNVTNMSFMFAGCNNLKELNLSSFNTQNVTNIKSIFYLCYISNYDLSCFNKFDKNEMISI